MEPIVHLYQVTEKPEGRVGRPSVTVRPTMVAYMMLGLIAVIAFLCVSQAIPQLTHSKPASGSSSKTRQAIKN